MTISPAGDSAVWVEFGNEISLSLNDRVHSLAKSLKEKPLRGVVDLVPAYASLLVCYDPMLIPGKKLSSALASRAKKKTGTGPGQGRVVGIPVCYGGDFAPDMDAVRAHTGFSRDEVIARHTAPLYRIYMLGFLPGFPYLGGLDPALETPRLETPRTKIPAGSVGIGGAQTGIYPLESPGGWRIIGRTPLKPYDPERAEPFLYRAGDSIRFYPVSRDQYDRIANNSIADDGMANDGITNNNTAGI
ncbi:MAG: 5-oxoprolinase subunit PxpB [Treponema sp.]|jgi:KipI family sensor histidine kinase inhibitor|nr:5-oxoprolinase subunit PxpB [Treponema sp.]